MKYVDKIRDILGNVSIVQYKENFFVRSNDVLVSSFSLVAMPGCCGICVSINSLVVSEFRGKGLGSLLNSMRKQIAWDMGYSLLMCTNLSDNIPQKKILSKNGWEVLKVFFNQKTGKEVEIQTVDLSDTGVSVGFIERMK